MDRDCVFCGIVARREPASELYRDERVTAFLDIRPVTPGHLLVVPNEHLVYLADVPEELGAWLFVVGQRLAAALRASGLQCEGINLFLADGKAAGQEVFHVHLHVFARFAGDGFRIDTPALDRPGPERAELDANAVAIRRSLAPSDKT